MYISEEYRKTKEEMNKMLDEIDYNNITPEILLMIDYVYHSKDNDYEGGLSFLDRLHWKLSKYYPVTWIVENLKNTIGTSSTPSTTFVDILNEILTEEMIVCYGI